MNEFQPLAEQEILFLFVATDAERSTRCRSTSRSWRSWSRCTGPRGGSGSRFGLGRAAFLLTTFSLVALEATTAQNDLVAASLPVVAACLLLSGGPLESALAGAAVGLGSAPS